MTMSKKTLLYKIGTFLLGPIYKIYYNPKIIGKENMQIIGPKIIVSNHIHLYDQCNTIISTKEFITYLAKKEYFDSKLTRWFFKSVGCISVDRNKKDEEAKKEALSVLNHQSTIGLFPEGTRNTLKEDRLKGIYFDFNIKDKYKVFLRKMEYVKASQIDKMINLLNSKLITREDFINNIYQPDKFLNSLLEKNIINLDEFYDSYLLEFKFGAVSMAQKEDAYIIPSCITGDYRFRSKNLKVRFGKPLKITGMDLELANKLLRDKIIELIKLNLT